MIHAGYEVSDHLQKKLHNPVLQCRQIHILHESSKKTF